MKAHELFGPSPEPDEGYRMAHRLLGANSDLDRRVLGALVGRPKRFSELKPVLDGRTDANLTQALNRLHRDGLVRARMHARTRPAFKVHELTNLGALVLFHMVEMRSAHESARILLRGRAADAA